MDLMKRYRRTSHGTVVVELAFTLPFLLLLILGALHYGWLFYHLHKVTNATRHAARLGSLPGRDDADIKAAIGNLLAGYTIDVEDTAQVNITATSITIDAETVAAKTVTVRLPVADNPQVLIIKKVPFGPSGPEHLSASVTMAIEGG